MTASVLRRFSTSAVVIAAAAAVSLGGSTEAWGQSPTSAVHHPVVANASSTWGLAGTTNASSTWGVAHVANASSTWGLARTTNANASSLA
jgi:hypothetical protein